MTRGNGHAWHCTFAKVHNAYAKEAYLYTQKSPVQYAKEAKEAFASFSTLSPSAEKD